MLVFKEPHKGAKVPRKVTFAADLAGLHLGRCSASLRAGGRFSPCNGFILNLEPSRRLEVKTPAWALSDTAGMVDVTHRIIQQCYKCYINVGGPRIVLGSRPPGFGSSSKRPLMGVGDQFWSILCLSRGDDLMFLREKQYLQLWFLDLELFFFDSALAFRLPGEAVSVSCSRLPCKLRTTLTAR